MKKDYKLLLEKFDEEVRLDGALCMWKDLYYQYHNKGLKRGITTFNGHENWNQHHPLYKCLQCGGYDFDCTGYKSIESVSRKK